jgi:capsular polysaccharide biosynthesis protein
VDMLVGEFGFEYVTMDGRSLEDEIELFSSADAIVGVHGAALTNLLWARPECRVLELFPYGWNHPGYQEIAAFVGCRYGYIVGSDDAPRAAGMDTAASVRRENDILIDPSDIRAAAEALAF